MAKDKDLEIVIPETHPIQLQPSPAARLAELEAQHLDDLMVMAELYERTLALEERNLDTLGALAEVIELVLGGAP